MLVARRPVSLLPVIVALALGPAPSAAGAVVIDDGHIDYGARIVGGKLVGEVKDQSRGVARTVWRNPADVLVRVNSRARTRLPSGLGTIGRAGSSAWLIPQVERRGVVWLGWNTEEITGSQVRGGLRWSLERVRGPGRVVVFQTGAFGDRDVMFTSARRQPGSRVIPLDVHAHATWAFTRRGSYRLTFRWSGRSVSGRALSHTGTLRVRVG